MAEKIYDKFDKIVSDLNQSHKYTLLTAIMGIIISIGLAIAGEKYFAVLARKKER